MKPHRNQKNACCNNMVLSGTRLSYCNGDSNVFKAAGVAYDEAQTSDASEAVSSIKVVNTSIMPLLSHCSPSITLLLSA